MEEKIVERRSMRHDFTATEINNISMQLALKTREHANVTEEKKSVTSQYASKLNEIKAATSTLSQKITDGFEMRDVECIIEYNKPKEGLKLVIRKDDNKLIGQEKMTDDEWNLFNQPKEDEGVSELLDAERDKLRGNSKPKRGSKRKKK